MNKLIWVLVSFLSASGFGKDYTPAEIKALLSSAEKGDARAQYEYGAAYYHVAAGGGGYVVQVGLNGGPANPAEAAKWFLRAAEQGHFEACYSISRMYDSGVGVIKSGVEAERWLKKAVQNSPKKDGGPEYTMGAFYSEDRPDLPKNEKEAAAWYRKAAVISAENAPWINSARNALALYHSDQKSSDFSLVKSYAWWSVAAVFGDSFSGGKREDLEKKLNPQELIKGRQMAAQILKEIQSRSQPGK